ncbi:site-specific integrase [Erythrobacter sp.]|uniref:site-specific integrase n=1 Tax=Erythrobacter sp. TaxID=1042 RepID=UPI001425BE04|nr:site-specific integrase [Erythrobacter sp.]QIQ87405.1 MAG: site-specific integrase [Erythrobacter sp.]
MASISKRKNGWCAQVRRKGYAPRSKTLPTKSAALTWAREVEARIDAGKLPVSDGPLRETCLSELIARYLREVTPRKRSSASEALRLGKIKQCSLAREKLIDIAPRDIAAYRDRRLNEVKPATVRKELYLLASVIEVATKDWGFPFASNPVRAVSFPVANDARDRRLEAGEAEKLHKALQTTRNPYVRPIVMLAIETGLRRREVLELTWTNVDLERRIAYIPTTKTGVPRTIPLTDAALAVIKSLKRPEEGDEAGPVEDRLFPITVEAFKQAWKRVQKRSGLTDLRFHDLRHEALSRFCELGLTVPELAVISGHKDPRMLFRYAHLRADDLARKLAGRDWSAQRQLSQGVRA